jgi:hypothetical protein
MRTVMFHRRVVGIIDEYMTVETELSDADARLALEDGDDPQDTGKVISYNSELIDINESSGWEVE